MKKLVSTAVAVLLIVAALAGCQSTPAPSAAPTSAAAQATATPAAASAAPTTAAASAAATTQATAAAADNPWAGLDLSKPETVSFYEVGTLGDDWQKVVDMANAAMKKKINTTVNFTYVPFSDFQSKYSLFLAGDQDVDCIYGAAWCNYMNYVKQGAYKALDQAFIQKNMPLTWKNEAPSAWKDATYQGKIYCVPNNRVEVTASGAVTTQDMLDAAGMKASDIKTWADLSTFMTKIATVKKGTGTYALNPQGSWPADVYWFTNEHHLFDIDAGSATWMVWDYSAGKSFSSDDLNWWALSPAYLDFCQQMAAFNKAGVFPDSVLQNQSFINDNFMGGKSALNFMTPSEADRNSDQLKASGKTLVYLDCLFDSTAKTRKGSYMGYGACFPVASKKAERAATALDCMKCDSEVNMLLQGGIEGTHYTVDKAKNTRALGPDAAKYQWDGWFYQLSNDSDPALLLRGDYQTINERYQKAQVSPDTFPLSGFGYDSSKYTAQLAVIASLVQEYRFSFCFGVFQDNTKAKYDEFIKKCKDAGIDNIIADYRAQVKAYTGK